MSNNRKVHRAAAKAAKEAERRAEEALDRKLCKVFAAAEKAHSSPARPSQGGGKKGDAWMDKYTGGTDFSGTRDTVTRRSATDARREMIERTQEEDRDLATMNRYQASLVRRRRAGEKFPD